MEWVDDFFEWFLFLLVFKFLLYFELGVLILFVVVEEIVMIWINVKGVKVGDGFYFV